MKEDSAGISGCCHGSDVSGLFRPDWAARVRINHNDRACRFDGNRIAFASLEFGDFVRNPLLVVVDHDDQLAVAEQHFFGMLCVLKRPHHVACCGVDL